jgi:UDP-glucose 4-epimerase
MMTLTNKRVLITGANGFVGRLLTIELKRLGAVVSTLTRKPLRSPICHVAEYIGDIKNKKVVDECIRKGQPQFIFHLAAFKQRTSDISLYSHALETNLIGTLNLLTSASKLDKLENIIVVGTAEEYGSINAPFLEGKREEPINAYSFSKLCMTNLCELLFRQHNIPSIIIRPTLVYGPGQANDMFLPALINSLMVNESFPMTPGRQTRDYIYISDLITALIKAAQINRYYGEVFNIGSGIPVLLEDFALMVEKIMGKRGLVKVGELDYRSGDIMNYYVDNEKANKLLKWYPEVDLTEGVRKTINYFRKGGLNEYESNTFPF